MTTRINADLLATGNVAQRVRTEYLTYTSTSTAFSIGDTIPTSSNGVELMTASVTPKSATNILVVESLLYVCSNVASHIFSWVLRDGAASAVASAWVVSPAPGYGIILSGKVVVAAGSTASTTFKLRYGVHGGNIAYVNGYNSNRWMGGSLKSFIEVTEMAA